MAGLDRCDIVIEYIFRHILLHFFFFFLFKEGIADQAPREPIRSGRLNRQILFEFRQLFFYLIRMKEHDMMIMP